MRITLVILLIIFPLAVNANLDELCKPDTSIYARVLNQRTVACQKALDTHGTQAIVNSEHNGYCIEFSHMVASPMYKTHNNAVISALLQLQSQYASDASNTKALAEIPTCTDEVESFSIFTTNVRLLVSQIKLYMSK